MEIINIRAAEPKDAAQIAIVHVKTWQDTYKGQIPDAYLNSLSIEKRTEGWRKQLENPDKGVSSLVSEVNGNVVGWCTTGVSRDKDVSRNTGELYGIYVLPDYEGRGLGSKLMDKALSILKREGHTKATLWVLETNEKTRKWYESKNWKFEGETKIEKRDDFDLHEVRYVIYL